MPNHLKLALPGAILCCFFSLVQAVDGAIGRLEKVARKYQEIGSYEASATASRKVEPNLELRVQLDLAFASPRLTPPDFPLPLLPPVIRTSRAELTDAEGMPAKPGGPLAAPGSHLSFDQVAYRVTNAKLTGNETLEIGGQSRVCDVIEAIYELVNQNTGDPVRYWVEPSSNTIWKLQFSERNPVSKSEEIIRWTVTFDKWVENQPPPQWLIAATAKRAGQEHSRLVGHLAPEISGSTTSDAPFQLSKLRGKVVVMDFWATWCAPCSEEMAALERLRSALPRQDFEIFGITEDDPALARQWLRSEERRVGKECSSPCRSRWSPYH